MPGTDTSITDSSILQQAFIDNDPANLVSLSQNFSLPEKDNQGYSLVVSTDTLVAGVHFPEFTSIGAVARKALAVNLSDLAAMAAQPVSSGLTIVLPDNSDLTQEWCIALAVPWLQLARQFQVSIHSVDVVRAANSPLSVHVQVYGYAPRGTVLTRGAAQVGDLIYVSGSPGEAALGLEMSLRDSAPVAVPSEAVVHLMNRLQLPSPRVELGGFLRNVANACIDVSDGLLADLGHICERSQCAARIELSKLPVSEALRSVAGDEARDYVLCGGDDYELCFTVAEENVSLLQTSVELNSITLTEIGRIESGQGVRVYDNNNSVYVPQRPGFVHFTQ
jgi:thiamine-monophosphate kinase